MFRLLVRVSHLIKSLVSFAASLRKTKTREEIMQQDRVTLPDTIVPIHYAIRLTPNFSDFTFAGTVAIDLHVKEASSVIVCCFALRKHHFCRS